MKETYTVFPKYIILLIPTSWEVERHFLVINNQKTNFDQYVKRKTRKNK